MANEEILNIFLVSDATGSTAESVVTAVIVQFGAHRMNVKRFHFVRSTDRLNEILDEAPTGKCVLVYTLVSAEMREIVRKRGTEKRLTLVDVMGPLLESFTEILQRDPKMEPGVLPHDEEDLRGLAEAIHFTRQHDDGLGLDTLGSADLIILGVSRTGKTPTSIFLSCRKLKVANIPIVLGQPFPKEVLDLPVKRVGFRMGFERLCQLRSERRRQFVKGGMGDYSSEAFILEELEYCDKLYRRIPRLRTIDVTNRSIEETSEWITRHVL
jgi:regulator of PEP synthase PpsR (kinase-PPPase family)